MADKLILNAGVTGLNSFEKLNVELKNINGEIQANREVRYFKDQQFLDQFYRFGFRWTQGSKD